MKFRMLGPVDVDADGRPVPLGGSIPQLMLAVLMEAEGELVPTERLLDIGWGEKVARSRAPRTMVHTTIQRLRTALKSASGVDGMIPRHEPGYRLRVDREDVDLHRFRDKADRFHRLRAENSTDNDAEIARLGRAALREWGTQDTGLRGREPLAGLDGRWVTGCRQRLRVEHRAVLIPCLEAELRAMGGARLVPELEELHRSWPLDERVFKLLLLALEQTHDRLRAIELFDRFERRVKDRHDIALTNDIKELYWRILEQNPAPDQPSTAASGGSAMPPDVSSLAQRMTEVLTPALPFLTGAKTPNSADALHGISWVVAKELWVVLHRSGAVDKIPAATGGEPDIGGLRAQLENVLSQDNVLRAEAAAILAGKVTERATALVDVAGHYFHQGDNISGLSIKHYNG